MQQKEKIVIGFPHDMVVDTEFCMSMMNIMKDRGNKIESFHCVEGTGLLSKSRNIVIKHFLDSTKGDWLLMVDTDERIPVATFDLLVATADKNTRPVVSGIYFAAIWEGLSLRPVPLIFNTAEDGSVNPWDNYPENSVVEVPASGAGLLLIHRSVLEKIRELAGEDNRDWCWFQDGPINNNRWLSEDLVFCNRITAAGFKLHAHTGATAGHHKYMWIEEPIYKEWAAHNEAGSGIEALK